MATFEGLPKEQHNEISSIARDAGLGSGQIAKSYLGDINNNSQGLMNYRAAQPNYGSNDNKALYDAIDRRSQTEYSKNISALKSKASVDAMNDRFTRLNQAAELVNAEFQHNEAVKQANYADKLNRKRARAAVLGNILGIAGAAGGAMVGGPAGAMAGYQIGQGVGGMQGG